MPKPVTIIYASTSGNVEFVCCLVASKLRDAGIETLMCRSEQIEPELLDQHHQFIFATSTWAHGELNPYFEPVYDKIGSMTIKDKQAAFIGLGDTRYEPVLFCGGMETAKTSWVNSGGAVIGDDLKINQNPQDQQELISMWADNLVELLQ